MSDTIQIWNDWNSKGGPKYPNEKVIQFTFRNFPPEVRKNTHVFDLGCGSGVNTIFFASEEFITYGSDLSEVGVANTKRKMDGLGLPYKYLKSGPVKDIDVPDQSIDLLVCIGVLDCVDDDSAKQIVEKTYNLLKKGGKGLFLFANETDFRLSGDNPFHFKAFNDNKVKTLFNIVPWTTFNLDKYITTYNNQTSQQHDYLISLIK